jgi:SpoVK/Ycf46/Vps4 family AAA+-type ATPase
LDKDRKTKELITALVSKQISAAKSTDVIAGKGNGLILLLHGGPGTGKTLTAEGVAEIAQKPLYRVCNSPNCSEYAHLMTRISQVTCGDVGTKAEEVEQYLESVLHLGKIWDCVVLLDEAEVFLERRSLDDLQRNALVSVFLRVIEYHEGILILTSNRVGTFDEAFRSRIQIAVHYPPLRAFQRLQIWGNFFDRLESFKDGTVDVDELRDHLEELQSLEINGRQIRNAITTARQYAEWKGKVMKYEHLQIALDVAGRFNSYSEKLRGGLTDDQIAEEEGIR